MDAQSKKECSCSSDLELAWNQNVAFKEINERLELSIRYGKCPHVLMQLCGMSVKYDQEFLTAELYKYTQQLEDSNPLRNATKEHSWVRVVHLLYENGHVLFGSDDTSLTHTWNNRDDRLMKCFSIREKTSRNFRFLQHAIMQPEEVAAYFYLVVTSNSVCQLSIGGQPAGFLNYYEVLNTSDIYGSFVSPRYCNRRTMEWLRNRKDSYTPPDKHIQWYRHVRSLQKISRRVLCSHYKGFKYIRFLKYNEKSIQVLHFIIFEERRCSTKFLSDSLREEYDESVLGVDEYFL
ncbi:unnamed protein product [Mytilus edulis]|uniref:Uncharacterized protein n=1 Tax=Mytilus edulis TaxID=6550 RepID=A0A8S3RMJ9_MYTED|nr:unnamed protein product [Mytilus edulis]